MNTLTKSEQKRWHKVCTTIYNWAAEAWFGKARLQELRYLDSRKQHMRRLLDSEAGFVPLAMALYFAGVCLLPPLVASVILWITGE